MSTVKKLFSPGRFIGDRPFYTRVFSILLPIVIQNTISNVVSLLDNVMVGQVGTLQMSAVAIINQLLFIFNLCIFGGLAGPGIFATQYTGAGDNDGVRHCFRVQLVLALSLFLAALAVFTIFPDALINMYLAADTAPEDISAVTGYAKEYLGVMLVGLLPFAVTQLYSMTLRSLGETKLPMVASISAILLNLLFNWLLIFGKLGFPCLGVKGAAIATVVSRFAETAIVVVFTHLRRKEFPFIIGAYKSLYVPKELLGNILRKGSPLLINEFLWSSGIAMLTQCYSVRGLDVVAAVNINSTISNLFNVVFLSLGNAVSIMVGQELGANRPENAKVTVSRLIVMSELSCLVMGGLLAAFSASIPQLYNTEDYVRSLATGLLRCVALSMPLHSFANCCYFTLRAGGKTVITFFFDSGFTWSVSFVCAYILAHFTSMPIIPMFFTVQMMDIIKCVLGYILLKKGVWIHNIVEKDA